ncbi:hypothetical protein [Flammeovirga sp. SJP92]|uniref:hypothetical protein n=1 Tax=Flammeovirga sp. SJP92 TaxID=1775430 RepID=UPI0007874DDB|nr:hypothetical protein [Flammeovirga sp. SJP92]KXX70381.1 hypothetical protein AVL50_11640 [Flammeovirga sp. SJP92]
MRILDLMFLGQYIFSEFLGSIEPKSQKEKIKNVIFLHSFSVTLLISSFYVYFQFYIFEEPQYEIALIFEIVIFYIFYKFNSNRYLKYYKADPLIKYGYKQKKIIKFLYVLLGLSPYPMSIFFTIFF